MANACVTSKYFSGQGALLLAERDGSGNPLGFRPVGNISDLTIGIETEQFEHKESCTGVRATDLTIIQETSANVSFTMESLDKENLALALFGTSATVAASSVTDEAVIGYHDLWSALANVDVSTVVVTDVGGATTYTEDTDYVVDYTAGSIKVLSTGAITDTQSLEVDYAYGAQEDIQAFTSGSKPVRYARFQGINTADNDKPFVVDIFKLELSPLAELALINDEISQMEVEAEALSDALQSSASKFFKIRKGA